MKTAFNNLPVTAAIGLKQGFFLEVPDRKEDFWLFMGDLVGWMRFSMCRYGLNSERFEAVEVLPPRSPVPYPVVVIKGVLWSRKAALEAEQCISAYLADLARIEAKNPLTPEAVG